MGALVLVTLMCFPALAWSHARLMSPPSRSSMWRLGFPTKKNFNDNALYCGGINIQWQRNGGKCGICGDPFNMPHPRDNEAGGKYGAGIISKRYLSGQVIEATVDVTTNHRGYFEFKLCPNNNPRKEATQECLDKHALREAYGTGTRYYIGHRGNGDITVKLQLPKGLTCSQCVFQWTYVAGNNWGKCEDGESRLGCGPQETFRGCADIAIDKNSDIFNTKPKENDVENNHNSIYHHKTKVYGHPIEKKTTGNDHMIYTYEVTKQSRQRGNTSTSSKNHNHSRTLDSDHNSKHHLNRTHIHNSNQKHPVLNHSHHYHLGHSNHSHHYHLGHSNHSHNIDDSQIPGNVFHLLDHDDKELHQKRSKTSFNQTGKPNDKSVVLNKRRYNFVANTRGYQKFDYRHFYRLSNGKSHFQSSKRDSINNNKEQRKTNDKRSEHFYPERRLPLLPKLNSEDDVSLSHGFSLGGRRYTDFWYL